MPRLETKIPEYNFLAAFWDNVRNDITGHAIVEGGYTRYQDRRIIKANTRDFIDTPDFVQWADVSGADPDALREDLLYAYLNS